MKSKENMSHKNKMSVSGEVGRVLEDKESLILASHSTGNQKSIN